MSEASLERGLKALKEQIDAPVASFFSSCVHCGMCAEACLFYIETKDPVYTPIHKLEPMRRLWEQEYTLFGRLLFTPRFTSWNRCGACGNRNILCSVV
jgi:Fe-S oxidoreductase